MNIPILACDLTYTHKISTKNRNKKQYRLVTQIYDLPKLLTICLLSGFMDHAWENSVLR